MAASPRAEFSREESVVRSALWAAAGDALGWITELSRGQSGVHHRTGLSKVTRPVAWQRLIGGRNGPRVELPAGTYSDDTQLRLAVSRSIRGNGDFDVEAFAKIEVTVWPSYALGAGLGTKAAAANLSRRSVNWFSNFFETAGQSYVKGGGNGAAMRIQPHVWTQVDPDTMLTDVLRDSLVTHGHPHGFCGAIFHARCVAHALETRSPSSIEQWYSFVDDLADLPRLVAADPHLGAFWQTAWEDAVGQTLAGAIAKFQDDARRDIRTVAGVAASNPGSVYEKSLELIGCTSAQFRGSGFKTSLAAAALAWLFRAERPEEALVCAANNLESDTDTIATMAGALIGSCADREPDWEIQDRTYLVAEARRLARIANGENQDSFSYPDLGRWIPPARQTAPVGRFNDGLAIAGLGPVEVCGQSYEMGDAAWQWVALQFGQTVLAKRKAILTDFIDPTQIPGPRQAAEASAPVPPSRASQTELFARSSSMANGNLRRPGAQNPATPQEPVSSLDALTDSVIQREFEDGAIGRAFNRLLDETRSIESAVAFAAIIAKAKLAREKRRRA